MPASPSTTKAVETSSREECDTVELARFRQDWFAELHRRKAEFPGTVTSNASRPKAISANQQSQPPLSGTKDPTGPIEATSSREIVSSRRTHPALNEDGRMAPSFQVSKALESALNIYRRAVAHEQRSELDQALLLYRQAFHLDDSVEHAYHYEQMLFSIQHARQESSSIASLPATVETTLTSKPLYSRVPPVTIGPLASLVANFARNLKFEPEDEEEPVFLNKLPDELLVMIIIPLDTTSIERFARVCKKARILTLDPVIWIELVRVTYHPPQVPEPAAMIPVIEKCMFNYRRVYIEQPRVRIDGVYIASCHYVRPGLSENSWVNVSHLITYHRYLRFFPNGQVLSLLSNEEQGLQQIISLLKPTLRMKGLFLGQWKLVGTTVRLSDLHDASGRFQLPAPTDSGSLDPPSGERAKYFFKMTLDLQTRPVGRWNKMVIHSYDSVNIGSGIVTPVVLKHGRPFWFSKVRSYVV